MISELLSQCRSCKSSFHLTLWFFVWMFRHCWAVQGVAGKPFDSPSAVTRWIFNFSVKIPLHNRTEIPTSSSSYLTVRRRFARTRSLIFWMWVPSIVVKDLPDWLTTTLESEKPFIMLCTIYSITSVGLLQKIKHFRKSFP